MMRCADKIACAGIAALLVVGYAAHGQDATTDVSTAQDCSGIEPRAPDGRVLTREEEIALLNEALLEAVNNFDPCEEAAAAGSGGGGSAGDGDGATDGGMDSVPVAGIQGTEAPPADPNSTASADDVVQRNANQEAPDTALSNGKLPEDIPPAENDDIIAAQLRQAAQDETDPVAAAKLWNEYRKYKGLPIAEVPEAETKTKPETETETETDTTS